MNKTSLQFMTLATPESPGPSTIADAIQLQAALHPKRPAIITSHLASFTFQDLGEHIRSVGEQLRAAGIGSSSRVGIALPKGPEAVVFGVSIAAHAISVPLNLKLTPDRTRRGTGSTSPRCHCPAELDRFTRLERSEVSLARRVSRCACRRLVVEYRSPPGPRRSSSAAKGGNSVI